DAWNVGRDLDPVGETDARHLPKRRVRLLRRGRVHAGAHAAALRAALQRGGSPLRTLLRAPLLHQLVDRRHGVLVAGPPPRTVADPTRELLPREIGRGRIHDRAPKALKKAVV